jgi:glycosyltransferase involved in cell wall biosynthesis
MNLSGALRRGLRQQLSGTKRICNGRIIGAEMTRNSKKISIIVPVYNASCYIERCLLSLKRQTLDSIEFLVINDGSTDDSLEKITQITRDDSRFNVIDQINSGVSAARNTGLSVCNGKYVMFVDSDDELADGNVASKLYKLAEKNKTDVIAYGNMHVMGNMCHTLPVVDKEVIFEKNENFQYAASKTIFSNSYRTSVWNKLFRTDIILDNHIRFHSYSKVISEDKVFNIGFFIYANKIMLLPDIMYNYYVIATSLSHAKKFDNVETRVFNTINETSKYIRQLPMNVQDKIFFPVYFDCFSICIEMLYRYNGIKFCDVLKQGKLLLTQTKCFWPLPKKDKEDIFSVIEQKAKRYLFSFGYFLVKREKYTLATAFFCGKSFVRRLGDILNGKRDNRLQGK